MAIYTFSTKTKKPEDSTAVESLKDHCEELGLNFSAIIINLIKEYDCGRKVQRSQPTSK